jgi:hypothetical protein
VSAGVHQLGHSNNIGQDDNQRQHEGGNARLVGEDPASSLVLQDQDPSLLYDLEKGMAESRRTTPNLLTQAEMHERGIQFMARIGIKCVKPPYPIPMNGDCLWSCYAVSRNPYLSEEVLKPEAFHLRLGGVGAAIDRVGVMGEDQLAMVQSVIAPRKGEPQNREQIIEELKKYMQSGTWSGDMGDLMPPAAASGLSQGLIIIHPTEHPYCTYAAPDCEMFRGKEDTPYPCIVVQHGNHFEPVLIHEDSKETARHLYERLKEKKGVTVQVGAGVVEGKDDQGQEQEQPPANQRSQTNKRDLPHETLSETKGSQTGKNIPTRCDNCGQVGLLGNHLREAEECLKSYRGYPEFQIQGDDEEFIAKACIIINECPAPTCPGGNHNKLPVQCLQWWKESGCKIMKWQGVDDSSSSPAIKRKMRKFRENYNRRKSSRSQPSQGVDTGSRRHLKKYGLDTKQQECLKCCSSSSPLAVHLQENENCLRAYQQKYFAGRRDLRTRKPENLRKTIFDLSLLLHFCPNPACSMTENGGGPAEHFDGLCSQYITDEAVAVYGWKTDVGKARFKGSLKRKATYLRQVSKEQQSAGPGMFRQELSTVLKSTCCTCFIQGPLLNVKDHKMVECLGSSPVLWQCHKCNECRDERQDIIRDAVRHMEMYGGSTNEGVTLKPVKVEDENEEQESIIFMPACLAADLTIATELSIFDPPLTTVLVPQNPDGLDVFKEEEIDEAFKERRELKEISEFITKRIFLNNDPTTPLSVLLRKKLADIREERVTLLKSMQTSSKGTVVSRNPNLGNIKSRNPHYAATKGLCLTNTCTWSEGHLQDRADDSTAISCANGQVKTKVKVKVLENLAVGSPELAVIMTQLAEYHFGGRGVALLSTAPIVLQFAKAKVELLMKQVISQCYQNWDMHISFKKDKWGVDLVGFLYSSEYDEINKKIAKEGASLTEIVEAVTSKPELVPTASLDTEWIVQHYGMSAEEAEVMESLSLMLLI